ncbi:MAG TPA: hypothetical protein VF463_08545 [Sphingobium sp.]
MKRFLSPLLEEVANLRCLWSMIDEDSQAELLIVIPLAGALFAILTINLILVVMP